MGNDSKVEVLHREDTIIENELGAPMTLFNTRVVTGMKTNIISLLQLVDEGWNMKIVRKEGKKYITVTKNGNKLVFCENDRKNLCFLRAAVTESNFIGNINEQDDLSDRVGSNTVGPSTDTTLKNINEDQNHDQKELKDKKDKKEKRKRKTLLNP